MKFRIIKLGKQGLDPRGFSFQYFAEMKVVYVRAGLFGIYVSMGIDIVKDFERMAAEQKAKQFIDTNFNRHQRRAMMALSRKHAQKA